MESKNKRHLYTRDYYENIVDGHQDYQAGRLPYKICQAANALDFIGKTVLDVGCGRGDLLKYCSLYGAEKVIGIDYSLDATLLASKNAPGNVEVYNIDMSEINEFVDDLIDCVYLTDVLEHVATEEIRRFLQRLRMTARKNVEVFAKTPAEPQGNYKGMHFNYWTKGQLMDVFSEQFVEVRICEVEYNKKHFNIYCKGLR